MSKIRTLITLKGEVRYQAQSDQPGQAEKSALFDSRQQAQKWLDKQGQKALKKKAKKPKKAARKHTLSELISRYRQEVLPGKADALARNRQLSWWENRLGQYRLAELSPVMLAEARDQLQQGRKPATVVRYLAALSHTLNVAVQQWGWLSENPIRQVQKPAEPEARSRCLTEEECQRLLQACRESSCRSLYPVVVLALATGMRQSEIMQLDWSQLDLRQGCIELPIPERRIPLVGYPLELMRDLYEQRPADTELVFYSQSKPDRPVFIRGPWRRAVQAAGVEDFKFHDLRHSSVNYLIQQGASLQQIRELLGHKSRQALQRYSHLSKPAEEADLLRSLSQQLFSAAEAKAD